MNRIICFFTVAFCAISLGVNAQSASKTDTRIIVNREVASARLDSLINRKNRHLQNRQKLDLLSSKFLKIDLIAKIPYVFYEFTNKSSEPISAYATHTVVRLSDDGSSGWSCSKGSDLETAIDEGASIIIKCQMRNIDYKKMKFPVTNPKKYNLTVSSECVMIKLDDKTYYNHEFTDKDQKDLEWLKAELSQ